MAHVTFDLGIESLRPTMGTEIIFLKNHKKVIIIPVPISICRERFGVKYTQFISGEK